jgi:hypothetical protein
MTFNSFILNLHSILLFKFTKIMVIKNEVLHYRKECFAL